MNNKHHPGNSPVWEPSRSFIDCLSAHTHHFHWQYAVIGWDSLVLFLVFSLFPIGVMWSSVRVFFFSVQQHRSSVCRGPERGSKLMGIVEHNRGYYGCV